MITRVKAMVIAILALITFVVIAPRLMDTFNTWECLCINEECAWCQDYEGEEWSEYHAEAAREYADEFTALFNSYETKRAKNGALMIRRGNKGSYKFAKKG